MIMHLYIHQYLSQGTHHNWRNWRRNLHPPLPAGILSNDHQLPELPVPLALSADRFHVANLCDCKRPDKTLFEFASFCLSPVKVFLQDQLINTEKSRCRMLLVVLFFLLFLCRDDVSLASSIRCWRSERRSDTSGSSRSKKFLHLSLAELSCSSTSIGSTARCPNININGGYLLEAWRDVYANTQVSRYVLHCVLLLDTYFTNIFCRVWLNRSSSPLACENRTHQKKQLSTHTYYV